MKKLNVRRSNLTALTLAGLFVVCMIFASPSVSFGATQSPKITHVIIIMMENENYRQIIGNSKAPYENYLASKYASAANFFGVNHPSLPNYLAITAGYWFKFGLNDQYPPKGGLPYTNIVDLLSQKHLTWKSFNQDEPHSCDLTDYGASGYTVHHDPFVYFSDVQTDPARCSNVISFTPLFSDISSGNLPSFSFIVPNDLNNSHDTGPAYGDHWLSTFVPLIIKSPAFASTALFIVYDESNTGNAGFGHGVYQAMGGHTVMVLVSPYAKTGFASHTDYSDYNVLATVEKILRLGNLGRADASAAPMSDLFTIAL